MKILASPARQNRDRNPFNFLLSEALAAQGCEVVDLEDSNGWFGTWDVFHIHWPQQAAGGGKRQALKKSAALVTLLALQRLRGARIVWTVHNVRGHDGHDSAIERVLMRVVARLVHGLIFLTQSSRDAACSEMPALKSKPFEVIPHGLYGQSSTRTRGEARAAFGLQPDRPTVGFLGDIKRYKGLDLLLTAFAETPPGELVLFIAGAFQHYSLAGQKQHAAIVRGQIADLQAAGYSVVFREGRLDDGAFADAVRACDVVALPYREIWNSGIALLVLENGGRILAQDAAVFRELHDELGSDFIDICKGNLTGEALVAAVRGPSSGASDRIKEFAAARSWPKIGAATLAFYHRLGADRRMTADTDQNPKLTSWPPLSKDWMSATITDTSEFQSAPADMPFVSVIVPAYEHKDELLRCLAALQSQRYAGAIEFVVVNNGAPGDLADLTDEFPSFVFIDEPNPGSYAARNAGIARAKGSVLAFTDADCRPDPTWIARGVRTLLADPHCGLVGGKVQLVPRNPARPSAAEVYDAMFGIPQRWYVERRHFAATANMLTRRDVIQKVGGFRDDLRSSGDAEWGQRVFAVGYSAVYDDGALVRHPARDYAERIKKLRRTVAGERDRRPDWTSCLRWSLNSLRPPPLNAVLRVLRSKDFHTTPRQKLSLLWLVFYLRWRAAIERLRLQVARDESPRA